MTDEPTVTLREHFDEKFKDLKESNEAEHTAVLARLGTVEEKMDELRDEFRNSLGDVVTWKSLGVSIGVLGGLVGLVAGIVSLLGVG